MSSAHGLAAKGSTPRRQGNQQTRNTPKATQNKVGGSERSRRAALRGRCFRCSKEDHLLTQCSYPASVKCNTCNNQGHISPACGKRQAANLSQAAPPTSSSSSPTSFLPQMQQLSLGFDGAALLPTSHLQMVLHQQTGDHSLYLRVLARFTRHLIGLLQRCLCD